MTITKIKVGTWYETTQGIGQCLRSGGTHPPSVEFNITRPFPRGRVFLKPREVLKEIPAPVRETV